MRKANTAVGFSYIKLRWGSFGILSVHVCLCVALYLFLSVVFTLVGVWSWVILACRKEDIVFISFVGDRFVVVSLA